MSWNREGFKIKNSGGLSTSSWGRELKWIAKIPPEAIQDVDLFVRSWVEIFGHLISLFHNLGRPLREVVSWNMKQTEIQAKYFTVDLFVRSWVEIWNRQKFKQNISVDLFVRSWVEMGKISDWNTMIKVDLFVRSWVEIAQVHFFACQGLRRPLREVVSWNTNIWLIVWTAKVDLFVRSWVEIKYIKSKNLAWIASTSSWGRELKWLW